MNKRVYRLYLISQHCSASNTLLPPNEEDNGESDDSAWEKNMSSGSLRVSSLFSSEMKCLGFCSFWVDEQSGGGASVSELANERLA